MLEGRPTRALLLLAIVVSACALPASAQTLPCAPCAGVRVENPPAAVAALAGLGLPSATTLVEQGTGADDEDGPEPVAPLFVAWRLPLDGGGSADAAPAVAAAGGTPWLTLVFTAPPPLAAGSAALEAELAEAARLARAAVAGGGGARVEPWFQIEWRPAGGAGEPGPAEYAFLLKRAAVAVSGAAPGAWVVGRALRADPEALEALYAEEVTAYLDAVAVAPAPDEALAAFAERLARLDPGRPLVVDSLPLPGEPVLALAEAARTAVAGAAATLFDVPAGWKPAAAEPALAPEPVAVADDLPLTEAPLPLAAALAPFALLAREFAGDVAYDPYSSPAGGDGAWSFVRGKDLGLRVIARTPRGAGGVPVDELRLIFSDATLRDPERVDPATGETFPLAGVRRSREGLEVAVADPGPVAVLRLTRPGAAELTGPAGVAGVEERLTVESERQMPVEEILRRLQAFEDAQRRRIDNYTATNTTHLRFGAGAGQTFEATLEGAFFAASEGESDWAWQTFYVNGVRWRGRSIPEIPLIQPERAAAPPLAITFDKTYRYRLRGTETIDGRDCWVVEFAPAGAGGEEGKLYRGTVWVDRRVYARVRTRAVQLGLIGEVLSNEETQHLRPIDAAGAPAEWRAESFVLPLRVVSNQLWSVVNATTQVERETVLTAVTINDPAFEEKRDRVGDTDVTMLRDTERGLRYLVKDPETGERVVQEGFDRSKWFLAGGVFYDDALDYPLPLAGVNYFSFDFKGSGNQVNAFLAGALNTINVAEPSLFGSRFDFGGDLFVLAVPTSDQIFRDDAEVHPEEIERRTGSAALKLGRPLGNFVKLGLEYRLRYVDHSDSDDTDEDFVLPPDTLVHQATLSGRYARSGYQVDLSGTFARRADWEFWGLPGNAEFDPEQQDYILWGASLRKAWYLGRFRKLGVEIEYFDGQDLDRFSKYEFGFFGDVSVNGYQSGRVRGESGYAAHLSYGLELGEVIRLEAEGDAAWVDDEIAGFDGEMLAGVGFSGGFVGPWNTLVNVEVGTPVAGPDDGFVAFIVFLKLFK